MNVFSLNFKMLWIFSSILNTKMERSDDTQDPNDSLFLSTYLKLWKRLDWRQEN